jgi:hypothetical protein
MSKIRVVMSQKVSTTRQSRINHHHQFTVLPSPGAKTQQLKKQKDHTTLTTSSKTPNQKEKTKTNHNIKPLHPARRACRLSLKEEGFERCLTFLEDSARQNSSHVSEKKLLFVVETNSKGCKKRDDVMILLH